MRRLSRPSRTAALSAAASAKGCMVFPRVTKTATGAAAIFNDAGKISYVPLDASRRFEALQTGSIDVLSRNTTWTMSREVELGLSFAGTNYYDGQGFLV